MTVRLLADEPEAPALEPEPQITTEELMAAFHRLNEMASTGVVQPPAPPEPRVIVKRALPDREILAAMSGLGAVLAVRLMLALAVVGAFVLAYLAMTTPTTMAIAVLVAYAVTTVGPLTYLSTKRT